MSVAHMFTPNSFLRVHMGDSNGNVHALFRADMMCNGDSSFAWLVEGHRQTAKKKRSVIPWYSGSELRKYERWKFHEINKRVSFSVLFINVDWFSISVLRLQIY